MNLFFLTQMKTVRMFILNISLFVMSIAAHAQQCMQDVTNGLPASAFTGSGGTGTQSPSAAFDNVNSAASKWATTSTSPSKWIAVNFGSSNAKVITGYLISSADFFNSTPRDWQFQGSNNGTTWTTVDVRYNQEFAYLGQSRIFSFSNITAYSQYRLLVTETRVTTSESVQIGEIELYEKVCLEGSVTDQGAPLAGVTVAMMGETYNIAGGGGTVLRTTTTDASGNYSFNASQIPDGQFSLIVQPPAGYQILTNTRPFFRDPNWGNSGNLFRIPQHWVTYDGSITFQNHRQLAQSSYWDSEQSETYLNRFIATSNKSQLNFDLKKAVVSPACVTLNGTPPFTNNLITVAQNGTFGSFASGTGAGSYVRSHPGQPGFSKRFANSRLYANQGFVSPTNTSYTYSNTATNLTQPGSGVLIDPGIYTVTSYIGTLADLIDGTNNIGTTSTAYTSLLNIIERGWRKTYGATTGDVYDKFLVINGTAGSSALFVQNGLSLKAGQSYLFSFDGKHANSSYQGIGSNVIVPYYLKNASNTTVASGTLTLNRSTNSATDAPDAPWQKVFATLVPPSTGTYSLVLNFEGGELYGNDFYIDNVSLRELTDYGDAPISYGSASHGIAASGISSLCDPLLFLGDKLDIENAYIASVQANADNLDNMDDEDGVTFPALRAGMTSYSVSVKATNLTATGAVVYGWIDWNHNGVFDASEGVSANVPSGSSGISIPLIWNSITTTGPVYARFRLSPTGVVTNASGYVAGGEVEDYLIQLEVSVSLSGTIFNDGNGLNPTPANTVDGTPIQSIPGSAPTPLHANLFDNTGVFIETVPVDASGNYKFFVTPNQNYSVTLSTTPATTASTPSTSTGLTEGWVNTGEFIGTGIGNDGSANGIIFVPVAQYDVTNVNFGIEQPPVADNKFYVLVQNPPSGQNFLLNGTFPSTTTNLEQLTGNDYEDGLYTTSSPPYDVKITTVPVALDGPATGGVPELWYNGVPVTAGQVIPGYNPALLEVQLNGKGYKGFEFTYQTIDAAGKESNVATYNVTWSSPLPVKLISFEVKKEGSVTSLNWSTTEEINNDRFEIERSNDAIKWVSIATKLSAGESKTRKDYQFIDASPLPGINYYRLKMIDRDLAYTYSRIRNLDFDQRVKFNIYPNPAGDAIYVQDGNLLSVKNLKEISVFNVSGVEVYKSSETSISQKGINVQKLPPGIYIIKITLADGTANTQKFIIAR